MSSEYFALEAGADCIGFAQRAASYRGNLYTSWNDLIEGWTEVNSGNGVQNIWDQLLFYANDWRRYRSYVGQTNEDQVAYSILHNRKTTEDDTNADLSYIKTKPDIPNSQLSDEEKKNLLARLKLVVPGDIWVKDSSSPNDTNQDGTLNTDWNDHIAIVASIPSDPESISDPEEYMKQMILIEGEFANKIQSVIKKLSLADYNISNLVEAKTIYPDLSFPKNGLELNCQSWAIRRLK